MSQSASWLEGHWVIGLLVSKLLTVGGLVATLVGWWAIGHRWVGQWAISRPAVSLIGGVIGQSAGWCAISWKVCQYEGRLVISGLVSGWSSVSQWAISQSSDHWLVGGWLVNQLVGRLVGWPVSGGSVGWSLVGSQWVGGSVIPSAGHSATHSVSLGQLVCPWVVVW